MAYPLIHDFKNSKIACHLQHIMFKIHQSSVRNTKVLN